MVVTTLIEKDGGIVAVIDNGIAHQFGALSPAAVFHVLLRVAGRHGLNEAQTVERLHVLLHRRDVHPAEEVAVALQNQAVRVVAHPCRNGDAYGRPLVGGALGKALQLNDAVVKVHHAILERRLSEARSRSSVVDGFAVDDQRGLHIVEIAVAPRPEVQVFQLAFCLANSSFARPDRHGLPRETTNMLAIRTTANNYFITNNFLFL